jgi:hypothetical protein
MSQALPKTAEWFNTQAEAMHEATDRHVILARDIEGTRYFGRTDDLPAYYKALDPALTYQVIKPDTPCPLYAQLKWIGAQEDTRIDRIVQRIREICLTRLKQNVEIHVSRHSTQMDFGLFRNEFHIVSPTIIFPNNHDGSMSTVVEDICQEEQWSGTVDLTVYVKNHILELPLCPFIRINDDGLNSGCTAWFDDPTDDEAWAPFILTNQEICADNIKLGDWTK